MSLNKLSFAFWVNYAFKQELHFIFKELCVYAVQSLQNMKLKDFGHLSSIKSSSLSSEMKLKLNFASKNYVRRMETFQDQDCLVKKTFTEKNTSCIEASGCDRDKMADCCDDQNPFDCPICLQLLKDPVTTACGHSFCMNCIKECWDLDDEKGVYSCPQCRQIFTPRPTLNRSTILAELIEKMKRETPDAGNASHVGPAESGDVECDVCIRIKLKAIKFCQMCVASYCEYHIQAHYTSPALKRHKLVDALPHLLEQICSQHDKPLELYCCEKLICVQCALISHQNHKISSPETSRKKLELKLKSNQESIQTARNQREKKLQELGEAMAAHKNSALVTRKLSEKMFTDHIRAMQKKQAEIIEIIQNQQNGEVSAVLEQINSLKKEISDLIIRHDELEQISKIEDDIYFIQMFSSLSDCKYSDVYKITVNNLKNNLTFDEIQPILLELKSKLDVLCDLDTVRISEKVPTIHIMESRNKLTNCVPSQSKTREEFYMHSSQLTLNESSACGQLRIQNSKTVLRKDWFNDNYGSYYNNSKTTYQVLCNERISGCCYFEVTWTGSGCSIAFSYDQISKGGTYLFGSDNRSWKCDFTTANVNVLHNNIKATVPLVSKIGVFVDKEAGTVCFYNVSKTMSLLHRIQTTFTEPIYPGFSFRDWGNNSSVAIE